MIPKCQASQGNFVSYKEDKRPSRHFNLHMESAIEQAVFYVVRKIKPTADCAAIDFSFLSFVNRDWGWC